MPLLEQVFKDFRHSFNRFDCTFILVLFENLDKRIITILLFLVFLDSESHLWGLSKDAIALFGHVKCKSREGSLDRCIGIGI